MLEKGIFTISIDTELAWGTFDHGGHITYRECYKKYRQIIKNLLRLFEKYEISATWGIVGHLFLDSCQRENGVAHPEIIRPKFKWFRDDWFIHDPCTDISKDELWYGSDIVEMIKNSSQMQEIGSHSFCHMIYADEGCSKKAAESDIKKCITLAEEKGINMHTFIFPRNLHGHLDLLSKYGFTVYRGQDAFWLDKSKLPSMIKRGIDLLNDIIPLKPKTTLPIMKDKYGLVEIPSSMLFRYKTGLSRLVSCNARLKRAKMGIDEALKKKKIFHMWLHPYNLGWDSEKLFNVLEEILAYADNLRKKEKLDVLPLDRICETYKDSDKGEYIPAEKSDSYNPESITMHSNRSHLFKSEYSDELKDYYDSAFKYGRKRIKNSFDKFLDGLNEKSTVLDVGCGTGYFLKILRKNGFECLGIDLSGNMIEKAKAFNPDVFLQKADAKRLPFSDNSFDAIVSIETLRYFSKRELLLDEIFRVTKPGGSVFITAAPLLSMNGYGFYNGLCRFLGLSSFVSCFQSFETAGSLKRRFEETGFKIKTVESFFFGPYFALDKISPALSSFLMRRLEGLDNRLSGIGLLRNFTNHLVCIAEKP